jgi:hypothetical protein
MSLLTQFVFNGSDYKIIVCNPDSNWDLYANSKGQLMSIAKKPSCQDSFYGDLRHLKHLIDKGWFTEFEFITEFGLTLLNGLHSQLMTDSKGHNFSLLRG